MDKQSIRRQFSYIENGIIYFNHASTGPIPDFTVNAINEYLIERSKRYPDNYENIKNIIDETKDLVAKFINTEPQRIAFVDNVSNAMSLLAQGLKWEKGDEIILFDIEFPANIYPFLNLQKQGVILKVLQTINGKIIYETVEKAITEKTKLLSISHVQFLSGFRANLELLGNICKQHGIIFSVDAIQSLGVVDLDVKKMKINFLASGIQKWLLGLEGTTIIYVSEELQNKIDQKYVGWLSVKSPWNILDYKLELDETARRFENGTLNYAGIVSLNSNIKFLSSIGIDNIEKAVLENSKFLIHSLIKEKIELFFTPESDDEFAGIVSIRVKDPYYAHKKLLDLKIHTSVREGFLRFSPHFYNTFDEIEKMIYELKRIINE